MRRLAKAAMVALVVASAASAVAGNQYEDAALTVDGLAVADRTVEVTGTEDRMIGPFPKSTYNDAAGKVQLSYDAVASLTIAVIRRGT